MGFYLNPGNDGFAEAIRSRIYVDKTGMIAHTNEMINTSDKYICVSRPRRFGKSMALQMLAAYYSRGCDSRELFSEKEAKQDPSFGLHLNQYDVVFLNMQQFLIEAETGKVIERLEQEVMEEIQEGYGEFLRGSSTLPAEPSHAICEEQGKASKDFSMGLAQAFRKIYTKTGKKFVFLIDEWDCVVRERKESEEMQKQYLDFLRNLLKDQPYVALAYMTGILPVKKYGQHSALNMFWEYSMTDQSVLEEYTGFTEMEVESLCQRFGMDFAETSDWYDGYRFRQFQHIYNPRSVVAAMKCHAFSSYWTSTETYEALKIYMDMDFDGLRLAIVQMLGGGRIKVNIHSFQNDMHTFKTRDDVLTLLIHLGYLAYDAEEKEAFIPNKEIAGEFENAMSVGGWAEVMRVLKASEKLLEDTLRCDEKSVAEGLGQAHAEVASILTYNDENSLSCAISLAYYSARKYYKVIRELPAGCGYADIVFLPLPFVTKPALVIELKYGKSAAAAIQQIKDRHYTQALEGYTGEILLVGVNYNKNDKNKRHSCMIEKRIKK